MYNVIKNVECLMLNAELLYERRAHVADSTGQEAKVSSGNLYSTQSGLCLFFGKDT